MFDFKNMSPEKIVKFLTANYERMKSDRKMIEPLREQIIRVFRPRRYNLLGTERKGQQYGARVYDGHPMIAANKFSQGLLGYMMSRSAPWLQFESAKANLMDLDEVTKYYQESAEQILSSFNNTNFYDEAPEYTKDGVTIGTAFMLPEENLVLGQMNYQTADTNRCYVQDDQYGKPAVFNRELEMTAFSAVDKFGKEMLPKDLVDLVEGTTVDKLDPMRKYKFLHCVYKNKNYSQGSFRADQAKYKVYYVLLNTEKGKNKSTLVMDSGQDYFVIPWRMGKESGMAYGTSLAADALTVALITNKMGQKQLEYVHQLIEPPMKGSATLKGRIKRRPGGFTGLLNKEDLEPLLQGAQSAWPIGDAEMQRLHNQLDDIFFVRFFEMLSGGDLPQVTAFQVSRMEGEKAILMGTAVGSYEHDFLSEAIDVQWDFETRAGRMPDAPGILLEPQNRKVQSVFLGPLAQLQRSLLQSKGIIDGMQLVAEIGAVWPEALMKIDALEMTERAVVAQGMPMEIIRSNDEVQKMLQAKAELAQQEQAMAQAETAANVLPAMAGKVDDSSVLARLTGQAA